MRGGVLGAALCAVLAMGSAAFAGCVGEDAPCAIEGGTYHAVLPEGGAVRGALVFLHGWGSSGQGSLRMTGMVRAFNEAGYAVIAPDGTPRQGRSGRSWGFHPDFSGPRNEIDFLEAVRDDAAARFGFDPGNTLLSGFSIGGSMASYVACFRPGAFAAYAPIGGGMWRPHPEACAGPVRLLHTHGWSDGTVPLEGRNVRGGPSRAPGGFVQGDVTTTLETFRLANGCAHYMPDGFAVEDRFWRRVWNTRCAGGTHLELVLHPGGHAIPRGWAPMALRWYEGL